MEEMHMNFVAIAVAAIIPMVVGFIYYHPKVLGGMWMKANGFTLESMGTGPKPILYGLALVLSFLLATFLCINVTGPGQQTAPDGHSYVTFGHGVVHGLILTILFILPILATLAIFEKRSLNWVIVNLLYWGITVCLMAGLLSAWR